MLIWTYWHSISDMPDLVKDCIQSWHTQAKGWEVKVITSETFEEFTNVAYESISKCGHAAVSDLVRLRVLGAHGGLWMDASVRLLSPLCEIIRYPSKITMYKKKRTKFPESWFIYIPPDKIDIVVRWGDNLLEILLIWPHVHKHAAYNQVKCAFSNSNKKYFMVYQSWFYLYKTDSRFHAAFVSSDLITVKNEMNPARIIPRSSLKLQKYTKSGRNGCVKCPRFILWPVVAVLCLAILLAAAIISSKKKLNKTKQ